VLIIQHFSAGMIFNALIFQGDYPFVDAKGKLKDHWQNKPSVVT
jgi:hypothetical protein